MLGSTYRVMYSANIMVNFVLYFYVALQLPLYL